jgi:hypothetical protein
MRRFIAIAIVACAQVVGRRSRAAAQSCAHPREQAPSQFRWIEQRFQTVLPALMRREGIDM